MFVFTSSFICCCCCSVPLPEFSSFILRHVVDLIYNGQIMVGAEVKPRIEAALEKLKINGVIATNPADQQKSTSKPAAPLRPTAPMTNRKDFNRLYQIQYFNLIFVFQVQFQIWHPQKVCRPQCQIFNKCHMDKHISVS